MMGDVVALTDMRPFLNIRAIVNACSLSRPLVKKGATCF